LRILVVEDNAIIGILLGEMLGVMGHELCGLEGTMEGAVAAACRTLPDLMIVDAQLGTEDGVAAMAQIMRVRPVAHVFISGGPVRTLDAAAVVLQKPFDDVALIRAMARACQLHAQAR
jgi:CheY-like chemotaxis protein